MTERKFSKSEIIDAAAALDRVKSIDAALINLGKMTCEPKLLGNQIRKIYGMNSLGMFTDSELTETYNRALVAALLVKRNKVIIDFPFIEFPEGPQL